MEVRLAISDLIVRPVFWVLGMIHPGNNRAVRQPFWSTILKVFAATVMEYLSLSQAIIVVAERH